MLWVSRWSYDRLGKLHAGQGGGDDVGRRAGWRLGGTQASWYVTWACCLLLTTAFRFIGANITAHSTAQNSGGLYTDGAAHRQRLLYNRCSTLCNPPCSTNNTSARRINNRPYMQHAQCYNTMSMSPTTARWPYQRWPAGSWSYWPDTL